MKLGIIVRTSCSLFILMSDTSLINAFFIQITRGISGWTKQIINFQLFVFVCI